MFKNLTSHICSLALPVAQMFKASVPAAVAPWRPPWRSQLQMRTSASDLLWQLKDSSDPTQPPSSHLVHRRRYIWPPGKHSGSLLVSKQPENAVHLSRKLNLTLPSPQQMAQPACYKVSLLEVSPSPLKTKHQHTLSESNLAVPSPWDINIGSWVGRTEAWQHLNAVRRDLKLWLNRLAPF